MQTRSRSRPIRALQHREPRIFHVETNTGRQPQAQRPPVCTEGPLPCQYRFDPHQDPSRSSQSIPQNWSRGHLTQRGLELVREQHPHKPRHQRIITCHIHVADFTGLLSSSQMHRQSTHHSGLSAGYRSVGVTAPHEREAIPLITWLRRALDGG
jgi:hypothetical protein